MQQVGTIIRWHICSRWQPVRAPGSRGQAHVVPPGNPACSPRPIHLDEFAALHLQHVGSQAVVQAMGVEGVTILHIKSHLQVWSRPWGVLTLVWVPVTNRGNTPLFHAAGS